MTQPQSQQQQDKEDELYVEEFDIPTQSTPFPVYSKDGKVLSHAEVRALTTNQKAGDLRSE